MTKTIADYGQIDPAELRATFIYVPQTGCLHRPTAKERMYRRPGRVAGNYDDRTKRRLVMWRGRMYPMALLVWVHTRGYMPAQLPVPKDGDTMNTSADNLTLPTTAPNAATATATAPSTAQTVMSAPPNAPTYDPKALPRPGEEHMPHWMRRITAMGPNSPTTSA